MTGTVYRKLRHAFAACLYYSGWVPLARWWARRAAQRLIILNYHQAAGHLRRHLLYLQRHYHILPLDVALEDLYAQKDVRHKGVKRTRLALTFDDGYYDNYVVAFALAQELRVPLTIFLVPGYVEAGIRFMWQEAAYLVEHAQVDQATIDGRTYDLRQPEEQLALAQKIEACTRYAGSVAEREGFLARSREALGTPARATAEERLTLPLTWSQAREMEATGWVTYGGHTMHHPTLGCLTNPAEVRREVRESRTVLEEQLGHEIRTFAYPFGRPSDIGSDGVAAVREAGYAWAMTTTPGQNTPTTNPYLVQRIPTDASEHWLVLAAQAAGVWWDIWNFLVRLQRIPATIHQLRKT